MPFAPVRIAHLADIHIGMENYGRLNPETGLNQRLHDFLRSLDQAIDGALAADVHLVVIAGDIYKTRDPSATHQREFARRIRRLVAAGVPVFIAAGNHDLPHAAGRATSVDIFRALDVPQVTVARTVSPHTVATRVGPVQVLAFPWTLRSMALAQAEFKNRTIAELNQAMIDLNRAKLLADAQSLDPTLPTIVVGHAHMLGARIGAERLLTMGNDPMYDLGLFDLPGVDYVALGHLHQHQAMSYRRPSIVYAGSIDRVDFGEEGEDKGWVEVELADKGQADWQFHRVQSRTFVTVDAHVDGDNATDEVIRAIARHGDTVRDAIVRLRIEIPAERLGELHDEAIRAQLKSAYHLTPIELVVRQRTRDRWGAERAAIQHASPLAALAYYLEHQGVEAARRELLLGYAGELMGA